MDDRYLNFNTFIKQRALQISKFTEILQQDTVKRTHQALPKSVRRRAMSHNRYRIPLKMRRPLQQELIKSESMQRVPKCRKSIRKRHRLIVSYKARCSKLKWLRTHLWAAKRMRIGNYAGFKVAQSPNNKSFRSAYRHFRHNCCLVDCSYLHCLTLRAKSSNIIHNFPQQIILNDNHNRGVGHFYEGQLMNGQKFVCPILVFLESNDTLRCIFDPYCLQQVNKIHFDGDKFQTQVSKSKSQIYLLLGPSSLDRINQAFNSLGMEESFDPIELKLRAATRPIHIIQSSENSKAISKPYISRPCPQIIVQGYNPLANKSIREAFSKFTKLSKDPKDIIQKSKFFWKFYDNLEFKTQNQEQKSKEYIMRITNRSKYTHKRKNKLTKDQKKKLIEDEANSKDNLVKEKEEKPQKIQPQHQQNKVKQLLLQQKGQAQDPIMLAPFLKTSSDKQMFQGCFILCSHKTNCQIWRALSKQNAKVIGRRELKHCFFEAGIRFFPDDYPQSACFTRYNKERAIELIEKHKRHPPQKRANYAKLNSPFPFYFHVPTGNCSMIGIKIVTLSRGRCFPGSYICRLSAQDYQKIDNQLEKTAFLKSITSEPKGSQKEGPSIQPSVDYNQTYEHIATYLASLGPRMIRPLIGFITYGGFKFSLSKEGGTGYLFQFPRAGKQFADQEYVLIRKPSSRFYFVGIAQRI